MRSRRGNTEIDPTKSAIKFAVASENTVPGGTDRNASTLELFFDLVYVFAITQVVGFIHHEPTATGFKALQGQLRGRFARDAYSILHYPLVVGIVFFAFGSEEVVAHPLDTLSEVGRVAIGIGIALVLMSIVASMYRAIQRVTIERLIASGAIFSLIWIVSSWNALTFVSVAVAATVAALWLERGRTWPQPEMITPDAT